MKLIWTDAFGSTYNEVIGKKLVSRFHYFNEIYSVGDVVEIYNLRDQEVAIVAELVTAGSNVQMPKDKSARRAIILRIIRHDGLGTYKTGDMFPAFIWAHDDRRMRHAPLETLARI